MDKIRVVYVLVDTRQLTLYKEDGTKITIPQGDLRVKRIVEEYIPLIDSQGWADIDLSAVEVTEYADFEKKTNGVVRFFKVAAKKVSSFFSAPIAEPGIHGQLPQKPTMQDFVAEVVANAKPALSVEKPTPETKDDTIVAVVGDVAIPNVQQLNTQIKHSLKLGSTKGMEALLKRLASVMDRRQHSVEDVLRFLENADLPIADDGTIIAYKILKRKDGHFVDCRTKLVKQKVGSVVIVDESLVDRNRKNECSNGLHVARRGYLGGFQGDVCCLIKVAPEDVVTVPHGDPNKVRVCAYHIISELSAQAFEILKSNRPMTTIPEAKRLLADAIAGNHVGKLEEVRITQAGGRGLVIVPLVNAQPQTPTPTVQISKALATDDPELADKAAKTVTAQETVKQLKAARNQSKEEPVASKPAASLSRKEQAKLITDELMSIETSASARLVAAQNLRDLKKKTKVSWETLGVQPDQTAMMFEMLKLEPSPVKTSAKTKSLSSKLNNKSAG